MKHGMWRAGGHLAALLGVAASVVGCTEEETGFFILGNISLDAPECIARPESTSTLLISGLLDVGITPEYEATLLVGNQLTPRGDKDNLRAETMITTISGAEVQLYDDVGAPQTEFTVPASGVILPNGGDEAGFGIISATLIPAAEGIALADEITTPGEIRTRVAEVTVFGKTIGGLDVESSPFRYVVSVCEGCIVSFPAGAYDPVLGCTAGAGDEAEEPPCRFGQDQALDCRLCNGSNPYCQFPGGVPPQ